MTNPQHQCHGVLAQAICDADPAAQISPELVHHLATRLEPLFNQRVAVFGRESKAQELVPQLVACPGCGGRLAECRSSAAAAIVVDLSGLVQKQHIPLRCRRSSCPDFGVLLWYNYTVRSGCHHFAGELPELNCFMLSATFGFSVPWLQQFHVRMVRQHASFTSEADVLGAQAAYNSQLHLLPTARLRLLISQGWFAWRLLTRVRQSNLDLASFDFLRPMEDMIGLFLPQLQRAFGTTTLEEAQKATMRCDVVVLDSNAKSRRAVCGASLEVTILQHKLINDGQCLMVLLKETAKLKPSKRPRREEEADGRGGSSSSLGPSMLASLTLQEIGRSSDPTDLQCVTCCAHKEGSAAQRQLAKSAGMLCACLSAGLILHMQEIYGCESLSQRYLCLASVKALLPSLCVAVHDDACHLHKYDSEAAAQIAPPEMKYVCDKFHMAGHTDAWCKETCDPALPANASLLQGIRTSVCEFTFTWLSKYKHQTKHMNKHGFQFFLLDMAWSHNEIILQGGYRPEEVAGSAALEGTD
ncbi:unnamed protein product [Durusdinium trenchii]|uniref:CxC6 like cysteine cluster associated with KDZ domain-containing protein n=1 Tax=Durusdinium trenchii TaxID=1381693 RepID=A0ABP0NA41_9DINO